MAVRYNLLTKETTDNDIEIFDLSSIDWGSFDFKDNFITYRITGAHVKKPWMISYDLYNTTQYEDILFLINNISNPLELRAGIELKVPDITVIEEFILANRNK